MSWHSVCSNCLGHKANHMQVSVNSDWQSQALDYPDCESPGTGQAVGIDSYKRDTVETDNWDKP